MGLLLSGMVLVPTYLVLVVLWYATGRTPLPYLFHPDTNVAVSDRRRGWVADAEALDAKVQRHMAEHADPVTGSGAT